MKKRYSSSEAARELGISQRTLYRWLADGSIPEPKRELFAGVEYRFWTEKELEKLRAFKDQNYRKRP